MRRLRRRRHRPRRRRPRRASAKCATSSPSAATLRRPIVRQTIARSELRPLDGAKGRVALTQRFAHRVAMAKECAGKFDVKTVGADSDLAGLADLYADAGMLDMANAAVARRDGRRRPRRRQIALSCCCSAVRVDACANPRATNATRGSKSYVDELDALPDADASIRSSLRTSSMNGYYRADDIDAGIIKHSTWLIETGARRCHPELRKQVRPVDAVGLREHGGGVGRSGHERQGDRAAQRAPNGVAGSAERRGCASSRRSTATCSSARAAPPITAPTWLNMPAGPAAST